MLGYSCAIGQRTRSWQISLQLKDDNIAETVKDIVDDKIYKSFGEDVEHSWDILNLFLTSTPKKPENQRRLLEIYLKSFLEETKTCYSPPGH